MPTKSLPTSHLAPLTEDKMYAIPRAYFWIAVLLSGNIVPWVVLLIVLDDAWWAFGPLFGNMYTNYYLMTRKTVKFSINVEETVTHYNAFGRAIDCQNAVPLSNYEKIRYTTETCRVIFVKTDAYYDSIVSKFSGYSGCVPFEESYKITDSDVASFKANHGFDGKIQETA